MSSAEHTGGWGPEPSHQEVEESYSRMDELRLELINQVLSECVSPGHLAYTPNNHDEITMQNALRDHTIIGIDMGSSGWFVPTWQFEQTEEGLLSPIQGLYEMWQIWGKGQETLSFCRMMMGSPQYIKDGRTRIDLLKSGDKDDLVEMRYTMQTRGINPM